LHIGKTLGNTLAQRPQTGNQVRTIVLALLALFLIIAPLFIGVYWNQVLGTIGLFVLLGLGLNIVVGFAGLLDLGYVGFYAIGAYTIAVLTSPDYPFGLGFWAALPIAMIAAAAAGALLGIPVLSLPFRQQAVPRVFLTSLPQLLRYPSSAIPSRSAAQRRFGISSFSPVSSLRS
jgi:branched-chain amino acid transport system permease protein